MEEHFGHKLARPVESLGAQLTDSSFLRDGGAGATFAGEVAVLVYEWNGFRLAILQGPPARAWRLRETVTRPDARFATGAGGAETAILPSTDKSAPLAFLALKGWVVKVEAPPAPGTQNADLTVEELSTFVMGLSV